MNLVPTDLAGSLIVDGQPPGIQSGPGADESSLIETMPVDSRNDPPTTIDELLAESGGGEVAFFIILLLAIGFIVVLVAQFKATKNSKETNGNDLIDDGQS